eukprot:748321-Hanusia_phi.AAC.5
MRGREDVRSRARVRRGGRVAERQDRKGVYVETGRNASRQLSVRWPLILLIVCYFKMIFKMRHRKRSKP